MRLAIAGLVLGLSLAACDPTGAACDFRHGSVGGAQQRCQDYHNQPTYNRQRTACETSKATWLDSPCPHQGAIGGCMSQPGADGNFQVDWYYAEPGRTTETVKMTCAMKGLTFLTP